MPVGIIPVPPEAYTGQMDSGQSNQLMLDLPLRCNAALRLNPSVMPTPCKCLAYRWVAVPTSWSARLQDTSATVQPNGNCECSSCKVTASALQDVAQR